MNTLDDAPRRWIPAYKYGRVMICGRRCEVRKNDWPNRDFQPKICIECPPRGIRGRVEQP